ncbi:MAG: carboxypeptidase regulatory-like domain-containing protein [Myxococcota bacterium]
MERHLTLVCALTLSVLFAPGALDESIVYAQQPSEGQLVSEGAEAVSLEEEEEEGANEPAEGEVLGETLELGEGIEPAGEVYTEITGANIGLDGTLGFHNIAVARGGGNNTFRVGFLSELFRGQDAVRAGDQTTRLIGRLLVQGTVLDYLTFNLGLQARNTFNSFGRPQSQLSQGDVNFGVGGFYPLDDGISVGGDLGFFIPTAFGDTGFVGSGTSVRPRLVASLDTRTYTDGKVPLDLHLNVAYFVDNSQNAVPEIARESLTRPERFAYGISAYDQVQLGIGGEYALAYVRPFLALNLGVPLRERDDVCADPLFECATEAGFGAFPKTLSLGARAEPIDNLGIHAGLDIGLTTRDARGLPNTPGYNFILGLSWTIDQKTQIEYVEKIIEKETPAPEPQEQGYIQGVVVDAQTQEPIPGARITYPGATRTAQSADEKTGSFKTYGFPPDTEVTLQLSHPDYKPLEVTQKVGQGDTELNFSLEALPKFADITGRILDTKDNPVRVARVRIKGEGIDDTVPVDAAGRFRKRVKPGKYTVAASATKFLTKGRDIKLAKDDTMALELVLSPEPKTKLVELKAERIEIKEKIFFETGEAEILPRSFGLLDQVASVLVENPDISAVRIEGHTDNRGADEFNLDLSQKRAEAVRAYLVGQGVGVERLSAKGFGATRPLLPNTSNRNRELNRRVEFNITSQAPVGGPKKPTIGLP